MSEKMKNYWPGWETVRLIGRGSFGAVYEIQREIHGRVGRAALKVISIPKDSDEIEWLRAEDYDDESLTRYFTESCNSIENEYALMEELKGHSNIVHCDDIIKVQQDNGFGWDIYIKMELLTTLKAHLRDKVKESDVITLGKDICSALMLCHKLNIVHRDIKPENIFVSRDGKYKLGDFGIARTMEGTDGTAGVGTHDYMAPEVFFNQSYGKAVDIYSLGIVMYWLLNNRMTPFLKKTSPTSSEKEMARHRRFSGEAILAPLHGSEELKRIVLKACAYDPKDRYASAKEMLADLNALDKPHIVDKAESFVAPIVVDVKPDVPVSDDSDATISLWGKKQNADQADIDENDNATMGVWNKNVRDTAPAQSKSEHPAYKDLPQPQMLPKDKKKLFILITAGCIVFLTVLIFVFAGLGKSSPSILLSDPFSTQPIFRSEIMRDQIKSITFLDSLKDAPDTAWDVSQAQDGSIRAWVTPSGSLYDLYIAGEGGVVAPEYCYNLFAFYSNLETIDFNDCFDTSSVTDMDSMFYICESLQELDLSSFDTSSVTDMSSMFYGCESLETLDLSGFDTSSVTDMGYMLSFCSTLETLDLSSFDTSSVTNMEGMFDFCSTLETLDLSNFDTSSVTNMGEMFYYCASLETLDLSSFDTSSVTNMDAMFYYCVLLETLDLSNFDTSSVADMGYMFSFCSTLETLDLSSFDTSSVTNMALMFAFCSTLETLDLSGFDTSSVADMNGMFYGCSALATLNLSSFDTSSVTDMGSMFADCESLETLDLSNFDTSSVTNMAGMFYFCLTLETLDLSSFDTSSVTDMSGMFFYCQSLKTLGLNSFDTSSVTNMEGMFDGCDKLSIPNLR